MANERQQIRATAMQMALAFVSGREVDIDTFISLADSIAKFIEGERTRLVVPEVRAEVRSIADQIKE